MRALVEVTFSAGTVGMIVPWMELDRMDPLEYLRPLAELLADAQPDAEWSCSLIPDEVDDKSALLGH